MYIYFWICKHEHLFIVHIHNLPDIKPTSGSSLISLYICGDAIEFSM
uniref:Uncharacterized protein n=1 Tax=Anguilla anguilla TaxID=7936 RepID=A0A0E9SA98_ANGAN